MTIEFPTTIQISFHKFTLTLFLQVLKFLSFKGINYKSHAKVLCTFKLNSQCHDSVPLRLRFPILVIQYAQKVDNRVGTTERIIKRKPKVVER